MIGKARTLEDAEREAQRIGQQVGKWTPEGWGFLLCLAELNAGDDGHTTYVCNMHRSTVPTFCRELAEKLEGNKDSMDVKSLYDPDMERALSVIVTIGKILSCPGIHLMSDASDFGPEGFPEGFEEEVKTKFLPALNRALDVGRQLVKEFKPDLLEDEKAGDESPGDG